jgi:hypothetical protein
MRVGAFAVDITPTDLANARLAGFGFDRVARGVLDPLHARVLYLSDGTREVAVAALDLIGVGLGTTRRIRAKVRGLAPGNVHVCCTHTHSGPDTIGFWGKAIGGAFPVTSGIDPRYLEWLEDEVAYAVDKAKNGAREARIRIATDDSPKDAFSRNIRDPGVVDPVLTALSFEEKSGAPIATLVHFGSHPEALWDKNHLVSADFVGQAMKVVQEARGGVGIYWNGALGGMVTVGFDETMPREKRIPWMKEAGTAIGIIAVDALKKSKPLPATALTLATADVRLPFESELLFLARNLGIFDRDLDGDDLVTEVGLIGLGPARIALFPGEPLPVVGLRVKEILGGPYPMMCSVANDEIGYVLAREMFDDAKYTYERSMSIGRMTADRLCEGVARLVAQA